MSEKIDKFHDNVMKLGEAICTKKELTEITEKAHVEAKEMYAPYKVFQDELTDLCKKHNLSPKEAHKYIYMFIRLMEVTNPDVG